MKYKTKNKQSALGFTETFQRRAARMGTGRECEWNVNSSSEKEDSLLCLMFSRLLSDSILPRVYYMLLSVHRHSRSAFERIFFHRGALSVVSSREISVNVFVLRILKIIWRDSDSGRLESVCFFVGNLKYRDFCFSVIAQVFQSRSHFKVEKKWTKKKKIEI